MYTDGCWMLLEDAIIVFCHAIPHKMNQLHRVNTEHVHSLKPNVTLDARGSNEKGIHVYIGLYQSLLYRI